jgi:L-asparaginase II
MRMSWGLGRRTFREANVESAPVLATVLRSGQIESVHRGAIAVAGGDGELVAAAGDPERRFYFRSSAKPIQLLAAVESGVWERYGFGDRELAVAVSSHSGAPRQVEVAGEMLRRVGLTPAALGCGYQDPRNRESLAQVLAGGERSVLYNNCSGKHAAMLALAVHLGTEPAGYLEPEHPAQARILERTCELAGIPRGAAHFGVDGCSAPTLLAPLAALAAAFARLGRGAAGGGGTASPVGRIGGAMARHPELLGEPESFNGLLAGHLGGRLIAKGGAEGLFCVAVPEADIGVAVRIEDGSSRALGAVVLALLDQLEVVRPEELGPLAPLREPVVKNWRGLRVGAIRPTFTLSRAKAWR